jgi:hypothetical protein
MTILTGHEIESVRLGKIRNTNTSDDKRRELLDNVRKKMSAATQARRLMCGAVGTLEKKIPGIVPGHAYGILGYDTKTDLVMVWNPWGNNRKAKGSPGLEYGYFMQDGKFLVPLTELVQFMHIEIETDRPRLGK